MSELEPRTEGTHILVKYRSSQGGDVDRVSGPVVDSYPKGSGWVMTVSPTRDLGNVRLEANDRGTLVKVRQNSGTWRRIGVAQEISEAEANR